MTTTTATINGVDVGRLHETAAAIQQQPELARFNFRSSTQWQGGGQSRTEIQGFFGAGSEDESRTQPHVLVGDEPAVLLGQNQGPNSVEVLLHALASCLAVGFVYNAAAQGIEIRSLDLSLEGDLDLRSFLGLSDEVRPGFEGIRVSYRVDTDAPYEQIVELCRFVQQTSPVLDMLKNPVPVNVRMES